MNKSHHDDTTPVHSVAIAADTRVRAPLGQVITAAVALAGAIVWCTCVWRDVQDLKRDMGEVKTLLHVLSPSAAVISQSKP